jgi:hypothetical protein
MIGYAQVYDEQHEPDKEQKRPDRVSITIGIIGKAPSGQEVGMLARTASSVQNNCTAQYHEGFMQGHLSRASLQWLAGAEARGRPKPL